MSNVYFNATTNGTIANNFLARALSWQGALFLANKSSSNLIINNTISYDQVYGVNVSSNGETFRNNFVNSSPQFGFYCSPSDSYPGSSSASSNNCFNNNGCAFLNCHGQNLPANISQVVLSQGVYGCGSINHPGTYALEQNIDMGAYLNVSNPAASRQDLPCIAVRAGDVTLNCAGHKIYNSTYPIGVYGSLGVNIENCNINNATGYGIVLIASSNSSVSNTTVTGVGQGGLLIQDSTSDNVTDSSFSEGQYGIVINNSQSDNLLSDNALKNNYGLYIIGSSIGNNFYNIRSTNNTRIDVYSSPNVSGAQTNFVSGMTCYNTNAQWAPCKVFVIQNLSYVGVSSCISIPVEGTYLMQSDIIYGRDNCMAITANNVVFNCAGLSIDTAQTNSNGFAMTIENVSNVLVENCTFQDFKGGIYVYKSRNVNINNIGIWNSPFGIILNATNDSAVLNSMINSSYSYGIRLIGTTNSRIEKNQLAYGPGSAIGIDVNNSRLNLIINNSVSQYHYGFLFTGRSNNNTVTNNTATISAAADYQCFGNGNLGDEYGGIDYGTVTIGCDWMATIQSLSAIPPCASTFAPTSFIFTSDGYYPYGSVCFTVNNNDTTINCKGATVIATHGGTFALFANGTSGGLVENCNLKGFTTAVDARGSATVYNNTILQTNSNTTAIKVNGFQNGVINDNNVTGGAIGIGVYNTLDANIQNNYVYLSHIGFYVYNAFGDLINGDYAAPNTGYGMIINNTKIGVVKNMNLNGGTAGLSCLGSAQTTTLISDQGGISCSSQLNCGWLKSSLGSC